MKLEFQAVPFAHSEVINGAYDLFIPGGPAQVRVVLGKVRPNPATDSLSVGYLFGRLGEWRDDRSCLRPAEEVIKSIQINGRNTAFEIT